MQEKPKRKDLLMFGKKKEQDPIELEKQELARAWAVEELDSVERQELIERYLELDRHQLEHEKIRAEHAIDAKTWLTNGVTIGLCLLTLNFEKFEVLRSKTANLWLRRRQ